jgi:hypothetical protein
MTSPAPATDLAGVPMDEATWLAGGALVELVLRVGTYFVPRSENVLS